MMGFIIHLCGVVITLYISEKMQKYNEQINI
jgi:hypothetical protein